jgi:hypothetical protein
VQLSIKIINNKDGKTKTFDAAEQAAKNLFPDEQDNDKREEVVSLINKIEKKAI